MAISVNHLIRMGWVVGVDDDAGVDGDGDDVGASVSGSHETSEALNLDIADRMSSRNLSRASFASWTDQTPPSIQQPRSGRNPGVLTIASVMGVDKVWL